MSKGEELLIVDGVDADREGLRKLFDASGYVTTAVSTVEQARTLAADKFFPAALIELDVDGPGRGLDAVRALKAVSPETSYIMLTGRRTFEASVDALRAGVLDVVLKRPEEIAHLQKVVEMAVDRYRARQGALLREVKDVLDQGIETAMALARRVYADQVSASGPTRRARVLVAEPHPTASKAIQEHGNKHGWVLEVHATGSQALEALSRGSFDVVASRERLSDLPGSTLLETAEAENRYCHALLFTEPGGDGRLEHHQAGHLLEVERPFTGIDQLIAALDAKVDDTATVERERRTLQALRGEHGEWLHRYARLKVRIDGLVQRS